MHLKPVIATIALTLTLVACGDSSTTPTAPSTTAPATTQERVKDDLKAAGQDIKDAGRAIAEKVDPTLEKAKNEAKDALHRTAEKIAEQTAPTQPAPTQP